MTSQFDSVISIRETQSDSLTITHKIIKPEGKKSNNFIGALLGALMSGLVKSLDKII